MRISLCDHHGKELDFAAVVDAQAAPTEAMLLLARRGRLEPGSVLTFDDDGSSPDPHEPITLTAAHIRSLASRLEARAANEESTDLRTAARFCRHALKVGWFGKTSIAIA
jgi:hypothetical protein